MLEWVRTMRDAIREIDETRPITLGVDPETLFRETGVDARESVELMEFGVSHVTSEYRAYAAEGPLTSGPSTYLPVLPPARLPRETAPCFSTTRAPTSLDTSVAEEAAYLRTVLWSGLMNRAAGVLARRYRDLETERREPYFIDPFESLVGRRRLARASPSRRSRRCAGSLGLPRESTWGTTRPRPSGPRSSSPTSATSRCPTSRGSTTPARACTASSA